MSSYRRCSSHTSHRTQPLDLTVFAPLKIALHKECDSFMKIHQHEKLTPLQLIPLFTKAYLHIANAEKAINVFKSTGIWPFDRNVFDQLIQEGDPSLPENVPAEEAVQILESENIDNASKDPKDLNDDMEASLEFSPQPSTSGLNLSKWNKENVDRVKREICTSPVQSFRSSFAVPFSLISPKPEATKDDVTGKDSEKGKRRCERNKQHSTIATGTPMKFLLEQMEVKKTEKQRKAETKNEGTIKTVPKKQKKVTKKREPESSAPEDEDILICDDEEDYEENLENLGEKRSDDTCVNCGDYGKMRSCGTDVFYAQNGPTLYAVVE